jgi:Mn2+/Fe2+ NRAMP family transporter
MGVHRTGAGRRPIRAHLRARRALSSIGPGLVAGASDNDPTTVATVAVVGSTTAYALGWVALLIFPMLAVVQAVAARVGSVTRHSLGDLVVARYGRGWSRLFLLSLIPVNVITLAADLKAGAGAMGLLTALDLRWFVVPLAAVVLAIPLLGSYEQVRRILQWIALALLTYGVSAIAAKPDWGAVLRGGFVPSLRWNSDYTSGALALVGTTLTSYVYVWETIELSEERRTRSVREAQLDAVVGAFFVVVVFCLILVATGATLGIHHHRVETAEDAARALRPIAGAAASAIFAAALLAAALLALPVLTATTAHVLGCQRGWRRRISDRPSSAPAFYVAMAAAVAVAAGISFLNVSTIHILFAASIAGGIGTPATLVFLLLVGRDRATMGTGRISMGLTVGGYGVALMVTAFSVAALATS